MEERELIRLLRQNPAAGIERAIILYGSRVRWIAAKILGERKEDIEECTAEVFVRLWRGIDRFEEGEKTPSLQAYVQGIARHTALDFYRRIARQSGAGKVISLEELGAGGDELGLDVDFADEVARKINARIIQETVDALPPPDNEIFISRYFLGLSVKEIAQRTELPEKKVENRLFRGKAALREALVKGGIIL